MARNVTLDKESAYLRIETDCDQRCHCLEGLRTQFQWILLNCHGVKVDCGVEAVMGVLVNSPLTERAQKVTSEEAGKASENDQKD